MQLVQLECPLILSAVKGFKISVHEVDGKESGLVLAFEGREDFDHPIDHLGAVDSSDFVVGYVIPLNSVHFL